MAGPSDILYSSPVMAALWSAEAHVRDMLAFEAALARAEARTGIIPSAAAEAIAAACDVERFDVAALYREASAAGTPAIPLVRMLTERVDSSARGYVHWGATSQDAIDTALVLQIRDGLEVLSRLLVEIAASCASLAERHHTTLMAGRTLLQQALPITFGLKAARWLALVTRQTRRLAEVRARIGVVQLGGAAGTLAALGAEGIQVTELMAAELGLAVPELPWHTERDRVAEVAGALGVVAGAMNKIAGDLVLLAQTEVGEAVEAHAAGKGASSTLPQKHNPVDATQAISAAQLALGLVPVVLGAMVQEHERAAGGWQAEWEALPRLFCYSSGAALRVRDALADLQVDQERMRANLTAGGGLIMAEALAMALAPHIGRSEATRLVRELTERLPATGHDLRQVAIADERIRAVFTPQQVDGILDPAGYLGSTDTYIERALAEYRATVDALGGAPHD